MGSAFDVFPSADFHPPPFRLMDDTALQIHALAVAAEAIGEPCCTAVVAGHEVTVHTTPPPAPEHAPGSAHHLKVALLTRRSVPGARFSRN
jgi:hypothetical protein